MSPYYVQVENALVVAVGTTGTAGPRNELTLANFSLFA